MHQRAGNEYGRRYWLSAVESCQGMMVLVLRYDIKFVRCLWMISSLKERENM